MAVLTQKKKKHNFFAGPAILPAPVLEQAAAAVGEFEGMGLSLLEISHRSQQFSAVMDEAVALTRSLLKLPDNYEVLFLTGGASSQFYMTAMNLLPQGKKVGFLNTGTWSTKAIKEAKLFGEVVEVGSSKDEGFNYIPKNYNIPEDLAYLHLTSNNTIYGTQLQSFSTFGMPLVCDMSSDIFSRPLDVEKFGLIYAGAQKNLGPAGTTLVIVNKDLLGKVNRAIPTMLDYQTHIAKNSSFNTPPAYPIYVCMLTMRWLAENGGVTGMQKRNEEKAALLYGEIDRNDLFNGYAKTEDRSRMNVTFTMSDSSKESDFLALAAEADCVGLKGHRSVGGLRASIYNAMDLASVEVLVDVMKEFGRKMG